MKILFIPLTLLPLFSVAQKHTPLPHGMVFGAKPEVVNLHKASELDGYMGRQIRTSVVVEATVVKVTNPKEGGFQLDAGNGKVINAHFQAGKVSLPVDLKGRDVIVAGVAARQLSATGAQHLAGRSTGGTPAKTNMTGQIDLEVTGLYVNK